ncbi:MAG: Ig-like domain-containing protein [Clostridia bacterium]|nr:Ig-like domain-containing protein [Clostridia bacterium]
MRRKIYAILIGLLSIFLLGTMAACSKGGDDSSAPEAQVSVTLDQTSVELDAYERVTLSATLTGTADSVVWSVANPAIASVENGVVIAKSVGETTVTATVGEKSATCAVRVYDSGEKPTYSLGEETLNLFAGDTFEYFIEAQYKGLAFEYLDVAFVSENTELVSADGNVLTAYKIGSTSVKATVSYQGVTLSEQTIAVQIVENYEIEYNVPGHVLNLVTNVFNKDKYIDAYDLQVHFLKNNKDIEAPSNVEITVADDTIIGLDLQTGKVEAKKLGTTTISVSFEENGITYESLLTVNVNKEVVEPDDDLMVLYNGGNIEGLDVSELGLNVKDILSVQYQSPSGMVDMPYTTEGTSTIKITDLIQNKYQTVIETAEKEYSFLLYIADYIIKTPQDFADYYGNKHDKYAIVANDIDCSDWVNPLMPEYGPVILQNNGKWTGWNRGTLDGRGYTVKGFIAWGMYGANTQFSTEGTRPTVKNIRLEYDNFAQSEQYQDGVFGRSTWGIVYENVYINMTIKHPNFDWGVFGSFVSHAKITNTVVNVTVTGEGSGTLYESVNAVANAGNANFQYWPQNISNVYVACNKPLAEQTSSAIVGMGWEKLNVISSIDEIDVLGGSYEKRADGLYFYGKKVMSRMPADKQIINVTGEQGVLLKDGELQINAKMLGLSDETVLSAYSASTYQYYEAQNGLVKIPNLSGGYNLKYIVETEEKAYVVEFSIIDYVLTTADDFAKYIANYNGMREGTYVVLGNDIEFPEDWGHPIEPTFGNKVIANNGTWQYPLKGVLDGQGYTVKGFTAWALFGPESIGNGKIVIKNIGLVYENFAQSVQYQDGVLGRSAHGIVFENVWIDMKISASKITEFNGWSVFGAEVEGCTFKNVFVNVTVVGTTTAPIYLGESGVVNSWVTPDHDVDNIIENLYVRCNLALTQQQDCGWQNAVIINTVDDIKTIGGDFELKNDGLYWNEYMALLAEPDLASITDKGQILKTSDTYKTSQYQVMATFAITPEDLGLTNEAFEYAYDMDSKVLYELKDGAAQISLWAGYENGKNVIFVTQNGAYKAQVIGGTYIIKTADDLAKFMGNVNGIRFNGGHGLVAKDIEFADDWVNPVAAAFGNQIIANNGTTWQNGSYWTLDGCGHVVSNFKMWCMYGTSYQYAAWDKRAVVKNIGFDVTQTLQASVNSDGVLCAQNSWGMDFSNVWMNITVDASQITAIGGTWGIFGNGARNCNLNDIVVNVNVVGNSTGLTIYNGITGSMNVDAARPNNLTNVYVMCNATTVQQTNYGFDKVKAVSKVSGITTIGGDFEVKADGLYWNKKLVKAI